MTEQYKALLKTQMITATQNNFEIDVHKGILVFIDYQP